MPRREVRQALYRGRPEEQARFFIGTIVHWLWYLCEEMPIRRHQYHQPPERSRKEHNPSLWTELVQTTQVTHAQAWSGVGISGN